MNYSNGNFVDYKYNQNKKSPEQQPNVNSNQNDVLYTPNPNPGMSTFLNYQSAPLQPGYFSNGMSVDYTNRLIPPGFNIPMNPPGNRAGNQQLFNTFDFINYPYPANNAFPTNYIPLIPNSSYYMTPPNVTIPSNPMSNQNKVDEKAETNLAAKIADNSSTILAEPQKAEQKVDQKPLIISEDTLSHLKAPSPIHEVMAPNIPRNNHLKDTNSIQYKNLNFDKPEKSISTVGFNGGKCHSIDKETYKDILESVGDKNIKKKLSDTIRHINPEEINLKSLANSRFFIIRTFSEDDIHRSIKYSVWCSTLEGNRNLDSAYRSLKTVSENENMKHLFLFFSVNGSGFFAGIAEMISVVDFGHSCGFWTSPRWKGSFSVKWHYVKDIRHSYLRHIRSDANDNKPVTNSRDAVEVTPTQNGIEFIKIFHNTKHETSIFDDYVHYERLQMKPNSK